MVVLTVRDLMVSSSASNLVRGISFTLGRGEALTILGESGSGKSLLSRAIMGTLPPDLTAAGEVTVEGVTTKAGSNARAKLWGRSMALLPQEPWLALDPTMRVVPQVAESYTAATPDARLQRAQKDLRDLNLNNVEKKYPFMLSGGMAQRAAFAATRAGGSKLLIVDEPTKGLDAELRDQLIAILRAELADGSTLLTITHDVYVARALGGRIAVMLDGAFVEEGPADTVLNQPRHEYSQRLFAAEPAAWPARPAPRRGDIVVTGRNLAKSFGAQTLFTGMDFDLCAGDRVAVTGPSGSGKTSLGNIVLGLLEPDTGKVDRDTRFPAIRFQKLYQDPPAAFAPHATLRQMLQDLIALHRLEGARVVAMMRRLRLSEALLDRRPRQISGGELQRFAMIRVLLLDPVLIFADEPTSRLDPITQQETINLLVDHAAEQNAALLFVTHDPAIAKNLAGTSLLTISGQRNAADL